MVSLTASVLSQSNLKNHCATNKTNCLVKFAITKKFDNWKALANIDVLFWNRSTLHTLRMTLRYTIKACYKKIADDISKY